MATCYRHPSRETGVSCSNCGRPICPDCMTPTPVGMRCPECSRQRTKVKTMTSVTHTGYVATQVLIAINVLIFLGEGSSVFTLTGSPTGPSWELSHGFLDAAADRADAPVLPAADVRIPASGPPAHRLEHARALLRRQACSSRRSAGVRFVAIYFVAALRGLARRAAAEPDTPDGRRVRGDLRHHGRRLRRAARPRRQPMGGGIGGLIVLNLVLSLSISGISIGGHIGGLIGGGLAALVWHTRIAGAGRRRSGSPAASHWPRS